MDTKTPCTAFEGTWLVCSGELREVALKAKEALETGPGDPILIFDDRTAEVIELDLRGTAEDVLARLPEPAPEEVRGPGRPKLGVVPREVTLLPRHWEWLNEQPGGASVAIRKLVDQARKTHETADRVRRARETTFRFMTTMGGNERGYEEAVRALFAGDRRKFEYEIDGWGVDIRDHALRLAEAAFPEFAE